MPRNGSGGTNHGVVGVDDAFGVAEDGPGLEVMLTYTERLFHAPSLVEVGNDLRAAHGVRGDYGGTALEPDHVLGALKGS